VSPVEANNARVLDGVPGGGTGGGGSSLVLVLVRRELGAADDDVGASSDTLGPAVPRATATWAARAETAPVEPVACGVMPL
jgi:hypothetical protein